MTEHWTSAVVRSAAVLLLVSVAAFVAWSFLKHLIGPLLVALLLVMVYRVAFLGFRTRR